MLHVVCDCGGLVSAPPGRGSRTVTCRACGRVKEVPDAAALGLDGAAALPPVVPAPVPVPLPEGAAPGPHLPTFGADQRLDLRALERHAERMLVLGRVAAAAGILAAGGAVGFSSRTPAERTVLASACLLGALLAWAALRGARAAALASIALAQRQREILRSVARG